MDVTPFEIKLKFFLYLELKDILECSKVCKSFNNLYLHMKGDCKRPESIIKRMISKYSIVTGVCNFYDLAFSLSYKKVKLAEEFMDKFENKENKKESITDRMHRFLNYGFYRICSTGDHTELIYRIYEASFLEISESVFSIVSNRRFDLIKKIDPDKDLKVDYTEYTDYELMEEMTRVHGVDLDSFCISAIDHGREDLFLELKATKQNPTNFILNILEESIDRKYAKVTTYLIGLLNKSHAFLLKELDLLCDLHFYRKVMGKEYSRDTFINLDSHPEHHISCVEKYITKYETEVTEEDLMILYQRCYLGKSPILKLLHEYFIIEIPPSLIKNALDNNECEMLEIFISVGCIMPEEMIRSHLRNYKKIKSSKFIGILHDNFPNKKLFKDLIMKNFWKYENNHITEFVVDKKYLRDQDCIKIINNGSIKTMKKIARYENKSMKGSYYQELRNRMINTIIEKKYQWKEL